MIAEGAMIGQTISHYKILEKIGEGGMGIVYKARDIKLDRLVALKFLPHDLPSMGQEQERLLQEARAASQLNHPNVCVIYGIEEFNGEHFIEMELVDGRMLRERIQESPLSVKETLSYAVKIGDALQEAHAKGIVHRDVKSENIMINSKNQIKVMDFGLAKLRGSAQTAKSSSTTGTLAYMAPELIQGEEADVRSDIFSFGVVLYEMLTGNLPFRGEHESALMYSIVHEEPQPIEKFRSDLSVEIMRIIDKALKKEPSERYQSAAEMVAELRKLKSETTVIHTGLFSNASHAIGTVSSLKKYRPVYLIAVFAILAVAGVLYKWLPTKNDPIDSVAVLPLINAIGDPDLDYLCDGITESVINDLAKISELRVIPRTTMFRFKNPDVDPQAVGSKLNVRAVLTGRVSRRGDQLNIQIDLIDIKKESQVWGQQFQSPITDILSLQTQITHDVSYQLRMEISGETQKQWTKKFTENRDAYRLYLQGRYYWNKRKAADTEKAVACFRQAIDLDPNYALAYAGMADCYIIQEKYADVPGKESFAKAETAARKALALDSTIAEAHTSLGFVLTQSWDLKGAEEEFKKAIVLNPKYATSFHWYSILLNQMGRPEEGFEAIEHAMELDPLSPVIVSNVAMGYFSKGDFEKAGYYFDKTLELDSSFTPALAWKGRLLFKQGFTQEAETYLKKAADYSGGSTDLSSLAFCYGRTGKKREALKIINELIERYKSNRGSAYNIARAYAGLHQSDKVFEWLEKEFREVGSQSIWILIDTEWDDYRSDPRYIALLKKVRQWH